MQPVEFFWQQSDIFIAHTALLLGAVFEIGLSIANLSACPYGASCILGVVVGCVSLLVGLCLWVAGMVSVAPPHFALSRVYLFRSFIFAFLMAALWFFCSVVNSFYFDESCLGNICATNLNSQIAMWMLAACWVSTAAWGFLMFYSVWRLAKGKKYDSTRTTEMESLSSKSRDEGFDPAAAIDRGLVLRSGYMQVRKVPLESNRLPLLWVRRYVLLTEGVIATYSSADNMAAGKGEVIHLSSGARVVETSSAFQPIAGSWGLEVPGRERLEFAVLETAEMESPNYSRDVAPEAVDRRSEWLLSMTVAIPSCVFGVPLGLAVARSGRATDVPSPVTVCVSWLSMHALDEQGLYRVPGSKADVDSLIAMFDRGQVVTIPEQFFGGNVASVIVQFLKRLPSTIFTESLEPLFERAAEEGDVGMLRLLLSKLPRPNYCTLRAIIAHLAQVAAYSNINEMDAANLSMCVFSRMAKTAHMLILNCEIVFNQPIPPLQCECSGGLHRTTCAFFSLRPQSVLERRLTNNQSQSFRSSRTRSSHVSEEHAHLQAQLRDVKNSNARIRLALEEQEALEELAEKRARQAEHQRTEAQVRDLIERMNQRQREHQASQFQRFG